MDRVTDIFEADVESPSGDLDADIAHAGHVLQKLAEHEGVDLDSMPAEDVADLVRDLLPPTKTSAETKPQEPQTTKEAAMTDQKTETTLPTAPTYADVAVELAKIAAAEGVDLAQVPREAYHEAFADLAQRMADPAYAAEKLAAEEKFAQAYAQGGRMAEGFLDRLKQAEHDGKLPPFMMHKKDEHEGKDEKEEERKKKEHKEHEAKEAAAKIASSLTAPEPTEASRKLFSAIGKTAGKKLSFEDAVLATARQMLLDNGINPETGEKIAAEPAPTEFTTDQVAAGAVALLKEKGYL